MRPSVDDTGFRPPARHPLGREWRTVLFAELVATVVLALCTLIAATVLSVGIARANVADGYLGRCVNGIESVVAPLSMVP